jgi:hypothetical protein
MTMPRSPQRLLRIAVLAAAAAFALAGCGGSGGPSTLHVKVTKPEAARPATQILSNVRAAVAKATSVHLAGHVEGTSPLGLNLHLARAGGSGTLSTTTFVIRITRIGHAAYFTGSSGHSRAFYTHFTTAAGAHMLEGRWLKVPVSDTRFSAFSGLTEMQTLLATILTPSGSVVKTGTRTLHGVSVIGLRDSTGAGTLYVAASGVPYPLELVQSGPHHGVIVFGQWNRPVTLTAPAHPVRLSQLPKLSG